MRQDANLHTVATSAGVLGVWCGTCRRRAIFGKDVIAAHSGNMQRVDALRFRCSACGSKSFGWVIPLNGDDAIAFLRGEDIKATYGAAPKFS